MPGPSPVNSACLDDGQEPTGCCKFPPNVSVGLEYVSARQDCNPSSCGETPCTSTEAIYDGEGNCTAAEQVCSPNWADLTPAEKCAAKRYLTITTVDNSGGETHGRTAVKQYTIDPEGGCDSETTCSGSSTTTVESVSEYTSSGSSVTCTSSLNTTETTVRTFNSDCTYEDETTCSGAASFDVAAGNCMDYGCESTYNEDCTWDGSDYYEGPNQTGSGCETVTFPFSGAESPCGLCDGATIESTTEVLPEPDCSITVTYSQENSQGSCSPSSFPAFPAFVDCTPEGQEPPEPPELTTGQGYDDEVFKYVSPTNPASKTEQKIRFRVKHTPTGTCYLKVWFRKKIQQWKYEDCDTGFAGDPPRTASWEGVVDCGANPCTSRWSTNGEPTFEAAGTYEWRGTGNPCFSDDSKPPDYCVNAIYSSEPVEVAATGNQTISIEFKFSLLEGYEPNWGDENGYQGCKPNGFPIPNPADCP